ncbi:MAG TPA: universal stress protein [Gaiellaceae bacterium]|nr:universal stress protein [Gaiellaceae bacterium]
MYTTLLWATDGSPDADLALDEALRLLAPGGKLLAFHCDQHFLGTRAGGLPVLADETDRRVRISEQVAELRDRGIDAELHVTSTSHSPAEEIASAAQELHVQAIVCGTRGLGGLQGALLGSVSRELLHRAHVPVVVVPARVPATA